MATRAKISAGRRAHLAVHSSVCECLKGGFKKGQLSPMKGKKMTEEQRDKYRKPKTSSHREALSIAASSRKYPSNWSVQCRDAQQGIYENLSVETKTKMNRKGTIHSEATKQKMSISHKGKIYNHLKGCKCAFHMMPVTVLEQALSLLLQSANLDFEAQKRFGYYTVDAWIPSHNLVFEADGSWCHQDKIKERHRDMCLIDKGVSAVIHLDEHDLDPWLEA